MRSQSELKITIKILLHASYMQPFFTQLIKHKNWNRPKKFTSIGRCFHTVLLDPIIINFTFCTIIKTSIIFKSFSSQKKQMSNIYAADHAAFIPRGGIYFTYRQSRKTSAGSRSRATFAGSRSKTIATLWENGGIFEKL